MYIGIYIFVQKVDLRDKSYEQFVDRKESGAKTKQNLFLTHFLIESFWSILSSF